jgi:hypothetical protein
MLLLWTGIQTITGVAAALTFWRESQYLCSALVPWTTPFVLKKLYLGMRFCKCVSYSLRKTIDMFGQKRQLPLNIVVYWGFFPWCAVQIERHYGNYKAWRSPCILRRFHGPDNLVSFFFSENGSSSKNVVFLACSLIVCHMFYLHQFKSLLGFKEGAFLYSNPQLVLSIIICSKVLFFVQVDTCLDWIHVHYYSEQSYAHTTEGRTVAGTGSAGRWESIGGRGKIITPWWPSKDFICVELD